jgi:hypothetical protein
MLIYDFVDPCCSEIQEQQDDLKIKATRSHSEIVVQIASGNLRPIYFYFEQGKRPEAKELSKAVEAADLLPVIGRNMRISDFTQRRIHSRQKIRRSADIVHLIARLTGLQIRSSYQTSLHPHHPTAK